MKKKHPSPFITEMMEKFQQQAEQSPTRTPPPQVSQSVQSSGQKRPENLPPSPKVAPPPPPRVRASAQTSVKNQETPPLQTKVAPPKPPRARDREQHSTHVQASPSHTKRVAPPSPSHVRDKTPTDAKIQNPETLESPSAPIKAAPQRPPRAKDREQHSTHVQASPSHTKRVAPPPPSRVRDKTPTDAKIQNPETLESPSAPIKAAPQRPPRARDREQHSTHVQASPSHTKRVAPPPPPRVRDKTPQHRTVRQQSGSSSQDSEIYAVLRSRKTHQTGERKQSDAVVQKTASPQTAIRQPKPSQEQKASINTMERELLLGAYHEEIRFLCEKVYGDRLILEQRIEEIKENPTMGEQLLWDMKENPQSISKLAGRKILGIKSDARKQAEETLPNLCEAINGFLYTSKYAKENILQSAHGEQRQHEHTQQEEAITQHTQSRLTSERQIEPLSNQEIARRVQQDPSVQYGQREVQYRCQIVYKDPFILQYRMEDMHKIPEMGEELVFQIEKDPTSFAPLAGRKALGIKNSARKAAEENLPTLCTAIKDYADTIKQLRETIVHNHQIEQQQRHQPLTDLDKQLQKQQSLSQPPQLPERSTTKRRQELSETSRKEERPPIQPRRGEASKAIALS
ncbi:BID domain-containing T4SS effector [Bartonella kosoyi]|uniref:BID domain-containing T4SS effector n=1 Tax=Bartonella kosoyi TaxID=2133959 RepID=A0A5B9CZ20_9HYPH|nr:BID domain-containing T4SS effector [Bartonella kosoyi]QEE09706.1 BID domain-containing T4SS effector [Bartonella kosoyi]